MLLCLTAAPVAQSAEIDLSTGEGAVAASRKIMCSLEDEKPVDYWWHGRAYSRVPGEADKLLFLVEGMNVRQCGTVTDPQRGEGYRLVSREILLYKDAETGEVLEEWENPWTGETVEVVHVTNDPVNGRPTFERTADGEPYRVGLSKKNNAWWMTITVPLFYPNPLGGDYQPYVGGTYHATEMFNFLGDICGAQDERLRRALGHDEGADRGELSHLSGTAAGGRCPSQRHQLVVLPQSDGAGARSARGNGVPPLILSPGLIARERRGMP